MLKRNLEKNTETTIKHNKATNETSFPFQPFSFTQEKMWTFNLLHVSLWACSIAGFIHLLQAFQAGAISLYTEVWNEGFESHSAHLL